MNIIYYYYLKEHLKAKPALKISNLSPTKVPQHHVSRPEAAPRSAHRMGPPLPQRPIQHSQAKPPPHSKDAEKLPQAKARLNIAQALRQQSRLLNKAA